MMKLLLIKSKIESKWGSCKVISPNLHQLYEKLNSKFEIENFFLDENLLDGELEGSGSKILELKEKINNFKPDKIIFIDHLPPAPSVMVYLLFLCKLKKLPPLVVHVYGDFTYFAREWYFLNEVMENQKMQFIVASDSQKKLVQSFLESGEETNNLVEKFCFPVNSNEYHFNEEERAITRNEHNLTKEDFVILYSGRISLQKNVDMLIREFSKLKKQDVKIHLWIVGAFDDIGASFMGIESYQGYMFSKIQELLKRLPSETIDRIKFFGHQKKENLRKIKAASDYFVSLSLYHDEDYGMSPAEALSTGLPSCLTNWGGYSSFYSKDEWQCDLIPVELTEYGPELDMSIFKSGVEKWILNREDLKLRNNRSRAFLNKFSIDSNVEVLEEILRKEVPLFSGFNWTLEQYTMALDKNWQKSKLNSLLTPRSKSFYQHIYKNYISNIE